MTKKILKHIIEKKWWWSAGAAVVLVLAVFGLVNSNQLDIEKGQLTLEGMRSPVSDLSGERCDNGQERPIAVMLANDPEARPLSGLSQADLVFEMPVTDGGLTRLMAVFQCHQPEEIGSVRSSRIDFIPLVQGLGAVYAHWGGEKEALAELNRGVVDNIDGMRYEGTIYYRKKGAKPPHNGFTSYELLSGEMVRRGFNLGKGTSTYLAEEKSISQGQISPGTIYSNGSSVQWKYQAGVNKYQRWRNNELEMDGVPNKPVEAASVIVMKTTWTPINRDYIRVKTVGSGAAIIYQNGIEIQGTWEKRGDREKLFFYDSKGQEIKFSPGQRWVEITVS
ncbi:MAG: DUF3048 domain-containing protein [bacterium]|nr:DUF3048 domain-containing protein [bacterium]